MGTSTLKSIPITNLDATPPLANTTGEGAPGFERVISDFVDAVTADDTSSTYRLCRFPSNAKIKQVTISSLILTAGSADINVAHSDAADDGTPSDKQGTIPQIAAADNKLFGAAQSLVLAGVRTDFTFKAPTVYDPADQNKPIWEVLGFTADPGGYFDILISITTIVTTGGRVGVEVRFVA